MALPQIGEWLGMSCSETIGDSISQQWYYAVKVGGYVKACRPRYNFPSTLGRVPSRYTNIMRSLTLRGRTFRSDGPGAEINPIHHQMSIGPPGPNQAKP